MHVYVQLVRRLLVDLLVQAIDFDCEAWRRQPLGLALADARAFDRSFSASASTVAPASNAFKSSTLTI